MKQNFKIFVLLFCAAASFLAAQTSLPLTKPAIATVTADKAILLVEAARAQVGKTLAYDPAYRRLKYPMGDVPIETGVCTDVIIRALRISHKLDLQKLVHQDMTKNFSAYPRNWGLKKPDPNIDHRRVLNLQTFFRRKGWKLSLKSDLTAFKPGDIVTCIVPPHLPHIMIVSDKMSPEGRPLIIHNIGAGAQEEDLLFEFKLTGHYRIK
jgi:uncharacterized protein YijF (DUF1287 family)